MKNISQIFKGNEHIMDLGPVEELIDYCRELEGQVLERSIDDEYSKEQFYVQAFKDIYESCKETLKEHQESERFKEIPKVDFKEAVVNLKKYIEVVSRLYNLEI